MHIPSRTNPVFKREKYENVTCLVRKLFKYFCGKKKKEIIKKVKVVLEYPILSLINI